MQKPLLSILALSAVLAGVVVAATSVEAGPRHRSVSVQGAGGHGYVRSRSISRQPGVVAAERSFQTNSGRGVTSARNATWGDGVYSAEASRTFNNGAVAGRSLDVTASGGGSASYAASRTRLNGTTATYEGVVTRD